VHSWPWEEIPGAATLDALYAELWDEIERQGRYRGPREGATENALGGIEAGKP